MEEHERPSQGIKIIDRRRFNAEGQTRSDANLADRDKPKVSQSAHEAAQKSREQQSKGQAGRPTTDFLSFIASLAANAMGALGAMPQAQARGIPVDHAMAREYIDIIAMLQERTKGNLTKEEDASLLRLMGELRSAYVEITRQAGAAGPAGAKPASKLL
ncbi:MAG: DUF1844 domain-containing protein [Deltaproteobacteria bacterium]|nr:MAG: DUF1844 domain-containing protein [Deltaproteobacteria bacterium]